MCGEGAEKGNGAPQAGAVSTRRFDVAIESIDAANAEDPNRLETGAGLMPAELVYGRRMSAMLARFAPDASELLRLAVRAQHIRRWTVPRSAYPDGRAGYHRWRNDLKRRHAEWAGQILAASGYEPAEVARVGALIRKEGLSVDTETQTLEDVTCLVFLQHYLTDFAGKQDQEKLAGILRKTWGKMSEAARAAALDLPLDEGLAAFVRGVVAGR